MFWIVLYFVVFCLVEVLKMEESVESTVELLKVLADSTRLKILKLVRHTEKTAQEIQSLLDRSQSTVSQQLKILTKANLLNVRQEGSWKFFTIKDNQIFNVLEKIESFILESKDVTSQSVLDTLHK